MGGRDQIPGDSETTAAAAAASASASSALLLAFNYKFRYCIMNMNHSSLYALFCFCLCLCAATNISSNSSISAETKFVLNLEDVDYLENIEKNNIIVENGDEGVRERSRGARRLLLGGPGSSPPRCASKCGGCMPCKPVHVPVPPGTRVTTEYYPEAWRCKCGNKLYMP